MPAKVVLDAARRSALPSLAMLSADDTPLAGVGRYLVRRLGEQADAERTATR
jgi:hypothetical protein